MMGGPMSGVVWSLVRDWHKAPDRGASRQVVATPKPKAIVGGRKA